MVTKPDPYICCLQKNQGTNTEWNWRAGKNYFMQKEGKKIRNSNAYIRWKRLWNKGHEKRKIRTDIMFKRSIQEEDIAIVNIYAPN